MDDTAYGVRDAKGQWVPTRRVEVSPMWSMPPSPIGALRWLKGYVFSWNLLYAAVAAGLWWVATPGPGTTEDFAIGWIVGLLVRNYVIVGLWYGGFHWWLYVRRSQDARFKYNGRWPATHSSRFTFGSQLRDNVFWSLASGVPIWTAFEVVTLWMFANGHIAWLDPGDNPVGFVAVMAIVPALREIHFYAIHRLIHWPPLYRTVHSLHHRNTNPGPWSGLSMHPLEHLAYFTGVLFHWVIPSHPVHAMFHLLHAVMAPVPGHTGFEKIELGDARAIDTGCLGHYLHHKYFEVNYGDASVPLDRWFGTFHDGSPHADAAMRQRRAVARAISNATSD